MAWGESAYGRSGDVEVNLHEKTDGDEAWELQIQIRHSTIRFAIASPETAEQILEFLRTNVGKTKMRPAHEGEHAGVPAGTPLYCQVAELVISDNVSLHKDGEVGDRFTFAMGCGEGHAVNIELYETDVAGLIEAFQDLWSEYSSG